MNKKMTKKETRIFGKGLFECVSGMAKNGMKAMDSIIVDPKTGKKYFLAINEISD